MAKVFNMNGVTKTIEDRRVTEPIQDGSLIYNGSPQSPIWKNYDQNKLVIIGTDSETDAGEYTIQFEPKSGYFWSDNSFGPRNVIWKINRATIEAPSYTGNLTYNGENQSPSWANYDPTKIDISGVYEAINAGSYIAKFTPKSNYTWVDGSISEISVSWSIGKESVIIPEVAGNLTYNGSVQSPSWTNYDGSKLTIGGTYSGTNAGTYIATFTPKQNYMWINGTTTEISKSWSISKASAELTLSATSISVDSDTPSKSVTITTGSNGALSVSSSNTSIATASLTGKIITITGVATGSTVVTITLAESENYLDGTATILVSMQKYNYRIVTETVTSSKTWRNPYSTPLDVTARVFGGGGGGSVSGGGGGHMAVKTVTVAAGESVSVTIGLGGAACTYDYSTGTETVGNGGTSSFGTYVSANGGAGGKSLIPSTGSSYTSASGGTGAGSIGVDRNSASTWFTLRGGNGAYGGGGGGCMTGAYQKSYGGSGGTYGGGGGAGNIHGSGGTSSNYGNGGAAGKNGESGANTIYSTEEFRGAGNGGNGISGDAIDSTSYLYPYYSCGAGGGGGGYGGNGGNAALYGSERGYAAGGGGGGYGASGGNAYTRGGRDAPKGGGGGGYGGRGGGEQGYALGYGAGGGLVGGGGYGTTAVVTAGAGASGIVIITYTEKTLS